MKTTSIALALGVMAVALVGCTPADRATGTVEYATTQELQAKADIYGTSPEFERDLRECLEAHPIPADHAPDQPAAAPLAECVADVYAAHGGAK